MVQQPHHSLTASALADTIMFRLYKVCRDAASKLSQEGREMIHNRSMNRLQKFLLQDWNNAWLRRFAMQLLGLCTHTCAIYACTEDMTSFNIDQYQ